MVCTPACRDGGPFEQKREEYSRHDGGELLRNRIVLEAKRLLVHTNETAAAIALQLNFEDVSYFGRFFKRETNQTPRQFRTHLPTKYQKPPTR